MDVLELYTTRMLVFLETDPQSNIYKQVLLDRDQYKKVSDAIMKIAGEPDEQHIQMVEVDLSEDDYELPDLKDVK